MPIVLELWLDKVMLSPGKISNFFESLKNRAQLQLAGQISLKIIELWDKDILSDRVKLISRFGRIYLLGLITVDQVKLFELS